MLKYKNKFKIINSSIIAQNKSAYFKYFIKNEIEAGISLHGWEVKSIRAGKVNINDSYVLLKNNEAFLLGSVFQPIIVTSHIIYDYMRTRKLLLNKKELYYLSILINRKGYTLVAISLYWKNAWIKIKIGVAKGKKIYDKRLDIKEREWKIKKNSIIKN